MKKINMQARSLTGPVKPTGGWVDQPCSPSWSTSFQNQFRKKETIPLQFSRPIGTIAHFTSSAIPFFFFCNYSQKKHN